MKRQIISNWLGGLAVVNMLAALGEYTGSICQKPLENAEFARNYPNFVGRACDQRVVNGQGGPQNQCILLS